MKARAEHALEQRAFHPVLKEVVSFDSGALQDVEALARFDAEEVVNSECGRQLGLPQTSVSVQPVTTTGHGAFRTT